jgi:hypothetical protein
VFGGQLGARLAGIFFEVAAARCVLAHSHTPRNIAHTTHHPPPTTANTNGQILGLTLLDELAFLHRPSSTLILTGGAGARATMRGPRAARVLAAAAGCSVAFVGHALLAPRPFHTHTQMPRSTLTASGWRRPCRAAWGCLCRPTCPSQAATGAAASPGPLLGSSTTQVCVYEVGACVKAVVLMLEMRRLSPGARCHN